MLASAILAPLVAWAVFSVVKRLPSGVRARQISGTAEDLIDLAEDVDPERDHIRGPNDAPVTLVEYGDFECPYCGQAEPVIRELLASFGDEVRYVWRHLPLNDVHGSAQLAAEAVEAAGAQGRVLGDVRRAPRPPGRSHAAGISRIADELGLDLERFWEEMRRHEYAPRIAEDVASADASGVSGTPTFFINGRRHQGAYDIDTLTAAVRAARNRAQLTAVVVPG